MEVRRRSPWLAGASNVLFPGLGHLYIGRAQRFLIPLVFIVGIYSGLGLLNLLPTFLGFVVALLLIWGLGIFSVVDVFILARRAGGSRSKWYSRWYAYVSWIFLLLVVAVVWPQTRSNLLGYETFRVPGVAMEPTIRAGDYILVNTRAYRLAGPEFGDVVVFTDASNGSQYIRRIAHRRPGDQFEVGADNSSMATPIGAVPRSAILGKVTYVAYSRDLERTGTRVK
jgi:signal peptidase I